MSATSTTAALLQVRNLTVAIDSVGQKRRVLDDVGFSLSEGQALGIVGESGSGKSLTCLSVMGLLPSSATVEAGEILLDGRDLLKLPQSELRKLRGSRIGMVLQDPVSSLDPVHTIGYQLAESLRLHRGLSGKDVTNASVELLERVHIPSPLQRLKQYPHELSGGMRQRVCSAIALSGSPKIFIADEPTTALDVTTQAQYLAMLRGLQSTTGFALILISHNLAIVRQMCDAIVVMYAGQVVEQGAMAQVSRSPQHPYTQALFRSMPSMDGPAGRLKTIEGYAPDSANYPPGCRFAPRCDYARPVCSASEPRLSPRPGDDRMARCFGTEEAGWINAYA